MAPEAMDPFTNTDRVSTIPGAFSYCGAMGHRHELIAGRYRPIVGPSEEARFQVYPQLLTDYVRFVDLVSSLRSTAGVPFLREGSQAQQVVSIPTGYTDGQCEAGCDSETGGLLPLLPAQAGRLFRYQRLTPVELTYSGLAADANWAYERSSAYVKIRTVSISGVQIVPVCTAFAVTFSRPRPPHQDHDMYDDDDD